MIVTVLECTHRVLLMLLITLIVEIITCPSFVHRRPSQRYRLVRFYFVFLNGLSLSAVEWPTPKVLQLHLYASHMSVHASVGESRRFPCVQPPFSDRRSVTSLCFDAWIVIKVSFSSHLSINTRSRDADACADMLILFLMCVLMMLATMAVHALSQHTDRSFKPAAALMATFSVVLRTWTQGSSHHCAPILDPGMMYLFFVIELAASVAVMHAPTDVDFSTTVDSYCMIDSGPESTLRGLLMMMILWIISFIAYVFLCSWPHLSTSLSLWRLILIEWSMLCLNALT